MPSFYVNLGPFSFEELTNSRECKLVNVNSNEKVHEFVGVGNIKSTSLSFLNSIESYESLKSLKGTFICSERLANQIPLKGKYMIVKDVQDTVAIISNIFYRNYTKDEIKKFKIPSVGKNTNISSTAVIENGVVIGKNVNIHDGAVIKHNCFIGNGSVIGNNTIISNSIIGENVVIGNNTSIGQSGFGFSIDKTKNQKIFHIGRVIIQENVNIGSNCTFDRGSFSDTIIGANSYFDNLCHVAHNVKIGSNNVFAAMSGIAGSAQTGNNVLAGGQVGISGHIKVGNNVLIAAKSAVMRDVEDNQSIMGNPAIDKFKYIRKFKKIYE